jgi:hypothetical protein
MPKWTVEFAMHLDAVFEGIEADTEEEARDIAIEKLLEDPAEYLDFDSPSEVTVTEDDDYDDGDDD